STVATVTELYHFIRLMFLRLGTQHCPDCGIPIQSQKIDQIVQHILQEFRSARIEIAAPLVLARKGYYTDLAAWAAGKGYTHLRVDGRLLPTDEWPRLDRYREHTIQLPIAHITAEPEREDELREKLQVALQMGKNTVHIIRDGQDHTEQSAKPVIFSTERACPSCRRSFPELDPRLFSYNSPHGWCPACSGTGFVDPDEESLEPQVCQKCGGARLRPEALSVKFADRSIAEFNRMTVSGARGFFEAYQPEGRSAQIARDAVEELKARLSFLEQVGLGYLSLERAAPTLSGGEAQRIRLAAQLGSNLRGVCYILDEPTIGLHPRDNRMLMDTLQLLKQKGNTVVVVEHDEETIRAADHVIDIGPGGGVHGGQVVFTGPVSRLLESENSPTGRWLKNPLTHPLFLERRERGNNSTEQDSQDSHISLRGVYAHNLKQIDVEFPVGKLIAVTGVSGSGKSSLARDVLFRNMQGGLRAAKATKAAAQATKATKATKDATKKVAETAIKKSERKPESAHKLKGTQCIGCREMSGIEHFSRALEVDQTPIGKTPRSCPATYVGFYDQIRSLFAATPEAKVRGYTASRFSFNVSGGRCEECSGQGVKRIEMNFLPDVTIPCEVCGGRRFNHETLEVTYKNKTIADVLQMSVEEATEFFKVIPGVHRPLSLLHDVGLGYLTLGQQSPSLSGGEAQRLKLVTELAKAKPHSAVKETLYILDEPTVGLHMADVEKLLRVLHRLVDAGNTIVIIEHNLDIIAEADWIIDLGPEGGDAGGEVVAEGSPEELVRRQSKGHGSQGYTAPILQDFLLRK
ncbi:MAG TPA: excinuclease ABC subunit A, partial [Clostridia bacterium]|nr:excinuclease ABC subunit A [Clostridia bacterium]